MSVETSRTPISLSLIAGLLIFPSSLSVAGINHAANGPLANREYVQDWKEFSSSVGGFSILFPKPPRESSGTLNVGQMIVNTRTYSVRADNTYTVMYFDVPHIDDAKAKTDLLLGFRNFALDEFNAQLVSDNPISIDDNSGRLLEMSVPKRGVARALILVTESRLYRVAVVPEKAGISEETSRAVATKFLESFKLLVIDASNDGEVDAYVRRNPELAQRAITSDNPNNILNGRALRLPAPEYPPLARGVHASGTVTVKVILDEEGRVIAAQAIGGHPLLLSAAVEAARKAQFSPTLEQGRPVKVLGRIQYNFF